MLTHGGSGEIAQLRLHTIQVEVSEVEEPDWDQKTISALLEENLNLHALIEELRRQIAWFDKYMDRQNARLIEEHRALMLEVDDNEEDLDSWIEQIRHRTGR